MGIAMPMGWLWFVSLRTCAVAFLMPKEIVWLMEAAEIRPCALDRVSK